MHAICCFSKFQKHLCACRISMAIYLQQAASIHGWLNNVCADCLHQLRMYLHSVAFGITAPRAATHIKSGG